MEQILGGWYILETIPRGLKPPNIMLLLKFQLRKTCFLTGYSMFDAIFVKVIGRCYC